MGLRLLKSCSPKFSFELAENRTTATMGQSKKSLNQKVYLFLLLTSSAYDLGTEAFFVFNFFPSLSPFFCFFLLDIREALHIGILWQFVELVTYE